MSKTAFKTNPRALSELLQQCEDGKLQLPDFQRSWVWAEDRILSLIASISQAFPVGALMTLEAKRHGNEIFARRPIEGASSNAANRHPDELLLDGQQRMTSLYHACLKKTAVQTITPQKRKVKRWFYIDISKSMTEGFDREVAIFTTPEDRCLRQNFNRDVVLDLSSQEKEYENMCFPLNQVFDWDEWQDGFGDYWIEKQQTERRNIFKEFKNRVLENFKHYLVPVIALADDTSHEAVCLVFEKVNTGGKPLDAFELLTAMYAAQGHKLRDDWLGTNNSPGIKSRLKEYGRAAGQKEGVLSKVASTDFLQAIALRYSKQVRAERYTAGDRDRDLPAIRATRQSLLDLPLQAYLQYRDSIEYGFKRAAKFLREQNIQRVLDLPYQSQLVPLAAIFSELGQATDHSATREKISRWYWCGVFGELYSSASESRFARDIVEVPDWIANAEVPTTVRDGLFQADRLKTMRSRQSAAYKGINALLMREGALDFRTGQSFDTTIFFDEYVDIHHIFPEAWCKQQGIERKVYDSVINKTPLSYRTNRIIGGVAPSKYLQKIEAGSSKSNGVVVDPPLDSETLDVYLNSHCIPARQLRSDDFEAFMAERQNRLLALIEVATGHSSIRNAEIEGSDIDSTNEEQAE